MAIELTSEEIQKVSLQKKSDENLPVYYDSIQKQEVKISRDFEAFLILSGIDLKRSAITWIQRIQFMKKENKERDELLKEVIELENEDANAQLDAYSSKLSSFDSFRQEFSAGKFVSVAEVSKFLEDLQSVIAEMISNRDRAYYNHVTSKLLTERVGYDEETEDKEKQLKSWLTPLSTYF